ncbi:anthranilate synthase component 1 [Enterobacteriaceae endosymbiont of Neohaemonia nigricornis]|uniref:anthranilate synthase component 1 n=1 Tax=Enterobacteriaceae endosymbiont of Neohaemonia nigricornis TaxID=2675792 RepID=UPI0014497CAA|nr:anthranilate synthase component 1 [Enterobacteriaceae endosymbiont of Neohaemonia nigricornis]QJC30299.1 anthranilate synthase component 1 [Enterobacteriaceae endosymbiont of Neohaemonia nigricornis]
MFKKKPILQIIKKNIIYNKNLINIFNNICHDKINTLLLESVDIISKNHLKSLLIIDSSLRIEALNNIVNIDSYTDNGNQLLLLLDNNLPKNILNKKTTNHRLLILPRQSYKQYLDEDTRLTELSVLDILRYILKLIEIPLNQKYAMFLGGFFSYDLIYNFEKLPKINQKPVCPDYCFYLAETLLIVDHKQKVSQIQSSLYVPNKKEYNRLYTRINKLDQQISSIKHLFKLTNNNLNKIFYTCNYNDNVFYKIIEKMQSKIKLGEIFQVVPSRKFYIKCANPLKSYKVLREINPSPYMFYMQDQDFILFGASPESSLKFNAYTREIEIYPIAGTRSRGFINGKLDLDLDNKIELEMRTDQKELSEHLMLVDLARNDLAKICIPGSRYVADLTKVDRYKYVMHLVSRVVGILKNNLDALHAYRACMNMGTLTGAPKIRAMEIISYVENQKRGSYGGSIGYLTANGDLDTCIIIRSAYIQNKIAIIQAGAGIVLNSQPLLEVHESFNKAKAVLNAITYTT